MPVYEYTALNVKGKTTKGLVDAESAVAARQKLRSSQIFPVSIEEIQETLRASKRRGALSFSFSRIRPSEIAVTTRQLATLLASGFPLVAALDALVHQTRTQHLKRVLSRIKDAVVEGNSFASALGRFPSVFSPIFINMVRAGESSGTLEIVLAKLADITEKQQALATRIRSALIYPLFMALIGTGVLLFLLTAIVPNITSIFEGMNHSLPAPTRFLIAASEFVKSFWWIGGILLVVAMILLRRFAKTSNGRFRIDQILLQIPGVGHILLKIATARFARTLGSLLENGVPMIASLEIVRNVVGNTLVARSIEAAMDEVSKGKDLGKALAQDAVFPHLLVQMIMVGEQSGDLEAMLKRIAEMFETEAETTIMNFTSLLEPLMILVMGVIVGFIVLSIILPIFEMNQLIR